MNPSIESSVRTRVNQLSAKLLKWREQKTPAQYPIKVSLNTWMEIGGLHRTYHHFRHDVWRTANKHSPLDYKIKETNYEINKWLEIYGKIEQDYFDSTINRDGIISGVDMPLFRRRIFSAQNGDSNAVEELEYSYIYYKTTIDYFHDWLVHSAAGGDPYKTYQDISGFPDRT